MNYTDNNDADEKNPPDNDVGDMLEIGISMDADGTIASSEQKDDTSDGEKPRDEQDKTDSDPLASPDDMPESPESPEHPEYPEYKDEQDDYTAAQSGTSDIPNAIKAINQRIDQLAVHFEGKLKYDEHKNQIIDDLHGQLQEFRDGIIKRHLLSMIMDIIKIIDDTRKFKAHYQNTAQSENTTAILLDFMDQIISDLEDLFTLQGVYPFTCSGDKFDSAKQRIVKKIETDDPEKHRRIAESLRPGYEWEGKIIRPEMVSIYECNDQSNDKVDDS